MPLVPANRDVNKNVGEPKLSLMLHKVRDKGSAIGNNKGVAAPPIRNHNFSEADAGCCDTTKLTTDDATTTDALGIKPTGLCRA